MQNHQVILSDDLSGVPRSDWDKLRHPSFYLSYDWLAARSITIGGTPHFLMIRDRHKHPLLGFPLYTIGATSHVGYDPVALLLNAARFETPACSLADLHVVQHLYGTLEQERKNLLPAVVAAAPGRSGGLSYGHAIATPHAMQALETACDAVDRLVVRAGAPLSAWLYVPEDVDPIVHRVLTDRGYASVLMDAESYLPVRWPTFEDYLRQFGEHRRRTIRQEMARFAGAGVCVEAHGGEALTRELALLELQWRAKYGRDLSIGAIETQYALLREYLEGRIRVFVAKRHERAIGFTVFFEHRDVWYSRFGGFDYDAGKMFSYFNLLFYAPIKEAIRRGITCIRYSTGGADTKRRRGCMLINLLMYVRFPTGLVPAAWLQTLDRIQHQRFAPQPPAKVKDAKP